MNLPEIQKIMMEFEKQSEIMDMKEEMMDDAIDSALGDDDDEIEGDKIVGQVLDELGIELTGELASELLSFHSQKFEPFIQTGSLFFFDNFRS